MKRFIPIGCVMALFVALLGQTTDTSLGKVDAVGGGGHIAAIGVLIETYEDGKLRPVRLIADYQFLRGKDGV
jgi:hypothetical protein